MVAATNVVRLAPGRAAAPSRAHRRWPSLAAMWRAAVTRRMLREMDDRMLADIGISRAQAEFEAGRLPWDAEAR